jgi:hypothetical protein
MKDYKTYLSIALFIGIISLIGSVVGRGTAAQATNSTNVSTTDITSYEASIIYPSTSTTTEAPKPVETILEANPGTTQAPKTTIVADTGCWMDLAAKVGWPADTLANLSYIINRESRCDPTAYNGKGPDRSYGLLQINTIAPLWGYVQKTCGINQPEELLNPETNLSCGLQYYLDQGWRPWHT